MITPDEMPLWFFLIVAPFLWFVFLRPFTPIIRRVFTRDFWIGEHTD